MQDDVTIEPTESTLLAEYEEIGQNLRHYANLQFAQVSIFGALAGAIVAAVISEGTRDPLVLRWVLCGAGALLAVPFVLMSLRVNEYWDKHVARAREIEGRLGMKTYVRPLRSGIQNRVAVMMFYLLVVISFIVVAHIAPR